MNIVANVLIIDDDRHFGVMLAHQVQRLGHAAVLATTLSEGVMRSSSKDYDVVLLDVDLPDGSGLEAIATFRVHDSSPEIIIITGQGDSTGAALAIQNGAWDYLSKSSSIDTIKLSLARALRYREQRKAAAPVALKTPNLVGNSPAFRRCLDDLARAARGSASVLIRGETGTGKELFASAIHENSSRADGPFVIVDCAALPENLVESALFGHEKGAFTGADRPREGLARQANGGTLFLDEVGELPLAVQPNFLRVLQEKRFRPVGSHTEVQSDFRLVAATNRNLEEMVERGQFRKDLLFRLQSTVVELPPLRERTGDIRPLALRYVTRFCELQGVEPKGFSPDFLDALDAFDWPGNIRELVNTIESAVATAGKDPILYAAHLPMRLRVKLVQAELPPSPNNGNASNNSAEGNHDLPDPLPALADYLSDVRRKAEYKYLKELLAQTEGNVPESCRVAGLGRSRLYGLLKEHDISNRR